MSTSGGTTHRRRPAQAVLAGSLQQQQQQQSSNKEGHHDASTSTSAPRGSVVGRLVAYLFAEEDAAWIGFYRMFWGAMLMWEIITHIVYDYEKAHYWYLSSFNFKFPYFTFVERIPFEYMKPFLWCMLALASSITLGFFYRAASILFAIGFGYMFLLEQALYLNHFYLIWLISIVMIFLPANAVFSIDALLWPAKYKRDTLPRIYLFTLRTFQAIVYFYAGVAKINADWLRAEPLRHWLPKRHAYPYLGWLLRRESTAYIMSYTGLVYDLLVGFLLMWRKTFWLGLATTLFFHSCNKFIFNIGVFPQLMIVSTTIYFDADWPRWLFHYIFHPRTPYKPYPSVPFAKTSARSLSLREIVMLVIAVSFLLHQTLLPLRHHLHEGDVEWTELGHRYSWRMKLRDKQCDIFVFMFTPKTQQLGWIPLDQVLHYYQIKKMESRPDMIAQFTNWIADYIQGIEGERPEIYVHNECSLNFRARFPVINTTVDMANVDPYANEFPWVVPMPPLGPEYDSEFPWNFEWNFNWLKGIDRDTLPILLRDQHEHEDKDRLLKKQYECADKTLRQLANKYYGGDYDALAAKQTWRKTTK